MKKGHIRPAAGASPTSALRQELLKVVVSMHGDDLVLDLPLLGQKQQQCYSHMCWQPSCWFAGGGGGTLQQNIKSHQPLF